MNARPLWTEGATAVPRNRGLVTTAGVFLAFGVVVGTACSPRGSRLGSREAAPPACSVEAVWDTVAAYQSQGSPSTRLAAAVPEFGGAYVDTILQVYLTEMVAADHAREVIDRDNLYGRRGREVRFVLGPYSYRQLTAWAHCMLPHLQGVVSFRVWERDNRIRIGVANDSMRRHIEAAITRLRLPRAAFEIERARAVDVLRSPANVALQLTSGRV